MRGGLVFFRGAGAEARAYLESDHSHADEYYLEGGGAVASWTAFDGAGATIDQAELDGATYQSWVDWKDPKSGELRGVARQETRVRENGEVRVSQASPRFVEMTVNTHKSLSVAAALDPEVSAALDHAQSAAVAAMNAYMAENSVTRVGARGAQRLVPVERLEAVSVVHRTSRAGDPHRHVHVQWSTRVFAEGKWRSLHTAATLKQQAALRGLAEAAIHSDVGLRASLAQAGFSFNASTGAVVNLDEHARLMSKRSTQVERNVGRLEAEWREEHPHQEPDGALRRKWDQQAWAIDRPRKSTANLGGEARWIDELRTAGLQVEGFAPHDAPSAPTLDHLSIDELTSEAVTAAESRRSAWSLADLEGHVGVAVAARGVAAKPAELNAYVRRVATHIAGGLPALDVDVVGVVPQWVRNLTSERVLSVERDLRSRLLELGLQSVIISDPNAPRLDGLNAEQSAAARALAGRAPLIVIEGAAGSGKTTMLGAARALSEADARRLVIVTPTMRAAVEAQAATGVRASSVHKLLHEHGFRWREDGRWSRLPLGAVDQSTGAVYEGPSKAYWIDSSTRIVIDEASMVDQDLAHAVTTLTGETGAALALIGDRAQLPSVGRGGLLDMAVAAHPVPLDMSEVHRFRQDGYAELTIRMRDRTDPTKTYADLVDGGHIALHSTEAAAWTAIARDVVAKAEAGATIAVAVTSNETAAEINALVQDARARAGHTRKPSTEISGSDGLPVRVGDRLMTRRNNDLGVANRDTWTVQRVHRDGSVTVADGARQARLPAAYVTEHTHLAYAATEYGVQGATVDYAHGIVSDSSSAQAVYVAATRGRHNNTLHIVAADCIEAGEMFVNAMKRDAGDRGIEAARAAVARDLDGVILPGAVVDENVRATRLQHEERVHTQRVHGWEHRRERWQRRHPELIPEAYLAAVDAAAAAVDEASRARMAIERVTAAEAERRGLTQDPDAPTEVCAEWAQAAVGPGASDALDAARERETRARETLLQLQQDPAPTASPPERAPTGTAHQEAAKDATFRNQHAEQIGSTSPAEEGTPVSEHASIRAARRAAEDRVHQAQVRAWEASTQRWQEQYPDVPAAEYPTELAASERAASDATAARESLETTIAADAIADRLRSWDKGYAAVVQVEAAAESASMFRRSAAQKEAEAARMRFQARHRAIPAPVPSAALKAAWARAATAVGVDSRLDATRASEQAAIARHARLAANPPPGGKPIAPVAGAAVQEARKDRAYAAQRAGDAARQEARTQRENRERQRAQQAPDRAPVTER